MPRKPTPPERRHSAPGTVERRTSLALTHEAHAALARLCALWGCRPSEAIRRALTEAAQRRQP